MRIQHNIAALNSHRQLGNNNNAVSKNLEKLSSGYRINRAGDDAAGLAISEKMRAQITGLNTAQKNANDGISLVQTAEGALTEVHSMLNRMVELADQSANGTYQDEVDRENIQKELDSLRSEIDRISEGTNFNGINLLDGSLGGAKVTSTDGTPASGGAAATKATFDVDIDALITSGVTSGKEFTIGGVTLASGAATKGSFKIDLNEALKNGIANTKDFAVGDKTITGTSATDGAANKEAAMEAVKGALEAGDVTMNGIAYTAALDKGTGVLTLTAKAAGPSSIDTAKSTIADGVKMDGASAGVTLTDISEGKAAGALDKAATLAAIGANIVGKDFTIGGTVYNAILTGSKLSFTAKTAGATTLTAAAIKATIKNDTNEVAEDKITNIVDGKAQIADTTPATSGSVEISFSTLPKAGDTIKVETTTFEFVANGEAVKGVGNTAIAIGESSKATASNFKNAAAAAGFTATLADSTVTITSSDNDDGTKDPTAIAIEQKAQGLTLQIGESSDSFNQLSVAVKSMSTKSLGIDAANVDVGTQEGAKAAIKKLNAAINTVSSTRGDLGAIQNRLEHTINNLGVTAENMSAAESRIRDVDMAQEMMNFTKNNILTQASQAMLAQANQLPQGVLQLLQ